MLGYSVYRTQNTVWRLERLYALNWSLPTEKVHTSREEAELLMKRFKLAFVRWDTKAIELSEDSWWYVTKSSHGKYDYSSNTRNQLKRGMKNFYARKSTRDFIANDCYDVYRSSFDRYRTYDRILSRDEFKQRVLELPVATDFWVVICLLTGKPVSFCENFIDGESIRISSMWHNPLYIKDYSGYVLVDSLCKYYISDSVHCVICNGTKNLSHDTNVHEFLIRKFKFEKTSAKPNILYNYWFLPIIFLSRLLPEQILPFLGYFGQTALTLKTMDAISEKFIRVPNWLRILAD